MLVKDGNNHTKTKRDYKMYESAGVKGEKLNDI